MEKYINDSVKAGILWSSSSVQRFHFLYCRIGKALYFTFLGVTRGLCLVVFAFMNARFHRGVFLTQERVLSSTTLVVFYGLPGYLLL